MTSGVSPPKGLVLPLPISQRVPGFSGATSVAVLTNRLAPPIFMSPTVAIVARGPRVKVLAELLLNVASLDDPPIAALRVTSLSPVMVRPWLPLIAPSIVRRPNASIREFPASEIGCTISMSCGAAKRKIVSPLLLLSPNVRRPFPRLPVGATINVPSLKVIAPKPTLSPNKPS